VLYQASKATVELEDEEIVRLSARQIEHSMERKHLKSEKGLRVYMHTLSFFLLSSLTDA